MADASRPSAAARALLRALRGYQYAVAHRSSPCRYIPSCSEYAREAVELHGAAKGSWLAVRRLGRCHPLGGFGFDPVPQPGVPAGRHDHRHDHGATPC